MQHIFGTELQMKLAKWNCVRKTARAYKRKSILDPLCKWRVQNIYKVNTRVGRRRNRGNYISRYDGSVWTFV